MQHPSTRLQPTFAMACHGVNVVEFLPVPPSVLSVHDNQLALLIVATSCTIQASAKHTALQTVIACCRSCDHTDKQCVQVRALCAALLCLVACWYNVTRAPFHCFCVIT